MHRQLLAVPTSLPGRIARSINTARSDANSIQYQAVSYSPAQIQAGFVDAYFYADTNCNIIFTAPSNGAVTTPGSGSDHTRSELRELYTGTGSDSNGDWTSTLGGTMTVTGKTVSIAANSDISTIGQIHGQTYVFMLLIYRPTQKDIAVDILHSTNTSTSSNTAHLDRAECEPGRYLQLHHQVSRQHDYRDGERR